MKFGDIFPLLLLMLILYYAAMIAMDLYKAKLEKETEKEKLSTKTESKPDETEDKDKTNSEAMSEDEEREPEVSLRTEPVQFEEKTVETSEAKKDPFDPESYKISDEVLAEHRKGHPESADGHVSHSKSSTSSGPKPPAPKKKLLRGPVMTNGIPADDLVSMIEAQSNGIPSDLQNFAYKCESA